MIRFTCKQCGKVYERPKYAAGSMVFCDCGTGNTIPWENDPAVPPPLPSDPNAPLPVVPVTVPLARPVAAVPVATASGCFNHPGTPATQTCADCGGRFCEDCVLTIEGQVRCGPCKNFHVRTLNRSAQMSVAAIFSLMVALAAGPIALFAQLMGIGLGSVQAVLVTTVVSVGIELVAIVLAVYALSNLEQDARIAGRGAAISGLITGLVTLVLTLEMMIHGLRITG
jgi:hypothetical protein